MKSSRDLLEAVLEARNEVEKIDSELQIAKEKKIETERSFIEHMDLRDTKSMKIETNQGLVGVVRKEQLYVSCNKDSRDELLTWIDESCGRSDMIKRNIHNKTLESFIKQRLKDGDAVPAFIKLFPKPVLAITKGGV